MLSYFHKLFYVYFIIILLLCFIYIPILYAQNSFDAPYGNGEAMYSNMFAWPIPGYTSISSHFGRRNSPTAGASSYHLGVDIPAPEGTYLYAIDDGVVTFASWGAGGGYTIVIELSNYDNMSVSYCHVSPIMFVERGESVSKKEIIGTVGPRNVYGIQNNPYKDENGNPTNGSTTGSHLHFAIKENGSNVDPLSFYE